MQKIDQEKLQEFKKELAEFQVEATKTATTAVYDRHTINKLEDHIVDLCQLAIDASHDGLKLLCELMRDNLRSHLVSGASISKEEFSLMTEWKSLVKAYVAKSDNKMIVSALMTNLAKPGWSLSLQSSERTKYNAILLGESFIEENNNDGIQESPNNEEIQDKQEIIDTVEPEESPVIEEIQEKASGEIKPENKEVKSDFDAFIDDSDESLADVFESMSGEDDDFEEIVLTEETSTLKIEDEEGLGSIFSEEQSLASCFTQEIEAKTLTELDEFGEVKDSSEENVEASNEESLNHSQKDETAESVEGSADDVSENQSVAEATDSIADDKEQHAGDDEIPTAVDSITDDLLVVDEDVSADLDDSYAQDFDQELKSAENALGLDQIAEESESNVLEIDHLEEDSEKSAVDLVVDDLFVETEDGVEDIEEEYEEAFDQDLKSAENALGLDQSAEESESIVAEADHREERDEDKSAVDLMVDDLFVATDDVEIIEEENEQDFDKDLKYAEDALGLDQISDESESIVADADYRDEKDEDKSAVDLVVDGLFVEAEDTPEAVEEDYEQAFDDDLKNAESEVEVASEENTELDPIQTDSSSESHSDAFVDQTDDVQEDTNKDETQEDIVESIKPAKKKKSRSIIEAYVDVIAAKPKPKDINPVELEQELIIDQAPIEKPPELESVEEILSRYPQWNDEQKELLSLIVSEVIEIIKQQPETLSVLSESPVNENTVREMIALYIEQIERMGSAAEMVGLDSLQKICDLISFHFSDLDKSSIEVIVESHERIKKWPLLIYEYLRDIHNDVSQEEIVQYISDENWARTIREDIKNELIHSFSNSTISIDQSDVDTRIKEASQEDVDISIPDDVQAELLDGLLQELPHQAEEFSSAMQELVGVDYLKKLEVAQRVAHTIKGAANTVGIVGVATLTHQLEDILQALVKAQMMPSTNMHVALVDASDCLEQMTEHLLGQGDAPDDAVSVLQIILDWANYIDEFGPPTDDDKQDSAVESFADVKSIDVTNETAVAKEAIDKAKSSQDSSLRVSANMIDKLINQSGESLIATSQMQENIKQLQKAMRDIKTNKDSVYELSQHLEHLIDVQGDSEIVAKDDKNDKFDALELDQFNELHTYSRRLIEATADSVELIKDLEQRLFSLESVVSDQSRAQKENQHAMLQTRMMPVESVIARLKRGVRQAAKLSNKSVELKVNGADTLVDSKILNNLLDPLMHLLRNAVDHGIENDEERAAQDKSLPGMITLDFAQNGERLSIKCHDDGSGLNIKEIRSKAIEKGLISEDQNISDEEIHQIIMQHGFSTRQEVTQLSGRGVGMDVVHSRIREFNGSVIISSQENIGTTVEISLPVSLLSAHALLVPIHSGMIAIASSGIEEIAQVNINEINQTDDGLTLKIDDEEYSAVHLEQLLGLRVRKSMGDQLSYSALILNDVGEKKKAVLVGEIQSVKDIVIKPFSHYLPKVVGLIGATVLGDGAIASVVDVNDLMSINVNHSFAGFDQSSKDLEEIHQASVLVVEDSISTRRSLAEFMQDLNYKVYTAKDGVEAIEVMRDHRPSILLTDMEMPRMNGLELTSHIRSNDDTKDIPIIMITSRTTEKHRQEAKSIGVNEYLTKPYVEDLLLEKVQSLSMPK